MSIEHNYTRVAKNTLVLYLRMLLTMGVSFYTTRITLEALGVDDYGVYNVLGGIVALCSILTGSLTVSISRFITLEIGRGNLEKLRAIFSTSIMLMTGVSVIIALLCEVGGIWFINHKMSIPASSIGDAHWVLAGFIFSFCLNMICVPYSATMVAHERMSAFAGMAILNAVLNLSAAALLFLAPANRLIYFTVYHVAINILNRLIYGWYCKRNFPEATYKWRFDRTLLRDVGSFTGWAFLGNGSVVIRDQGTNILMNVFCGLAVNAARGVANQVAGALESLVNNFMMAVNPQITKAYAVRDLTYMNSLIEKSAKFGFFIMFIFAFPVLANIDYLLRWWLTEVPPYTHGFVVWLVVYFLLNCICSPLVTGVLAEGNIKRYEILLTATNLLNFVASYVLLWLGISPVMVIVANVVFKLLILVLLLKTGAARFALHIPSYLGHVVLPLVVVSAICITMRLLLWKYGAENFMQLLMYGVGYFILSTTTTYFIGLRVTERTFIINNIRAKIKRR